MITCVCVVHKVPTEYMSQDDFTREDFDSMPAPLTYKMFKAKTQYPLHTAVRMQREDVLFLYLVENDSLVNENTTQYDNQNGISFDAK